MGAALLILFAGLIAGTFGYNLLRRYEPAVFGNRWVALTLTVSFSALALFLFLLSVYYRLTNARLTRRGMLPGGIIGAFFAIGRHSACPTRRGYPRTVGEPEATTAPPEIVLAPWDRKPLVRPEVTGP